MQFIFYIFTPLLCNIEMFCIVFSCIVVSAALNETKPLAVQSEAVGLISIEQQIVHDKRELNEALFWIIPYTL